MESIEKLYYTISEVAEATGLKQYVLRYWESEFPQLQPIKNRSGNRVYTKEDIEIVQRIKTLLYEEKYTIEGAKRRLSESESPVRDEEKIREALNRIRHDVQRMMDHLDDREA